MLEDLRRPVIARYQDIGKRLVVAQLHVEARPQLLDQVGLEQQRLGFGRGGDDLDRDGGRDHAQDARRLRRVDPRIGRQPLADVLGLADIEHVAGRIQHAIDAGRSRGEPYRVFDRGVTGRERAFRHAFCWLLRNFRQPCLVVLLGDQHRGVDVGRSRRRCLRRRGEWFGTALRRPRACALRAIGRIVIHEPKLKRRHRPSPAPRRRNCSTPRRRARNVSLRMPSGRVQALTTL